MRTSSWEWGSASSQFCQPLYTVTLLPERTESYEEESALLWKVDARHPSSFSVCRSPWEGCPRTGESRALGQAGGLGRAEQAGSSDVGQRGSRAEGVRAILVPL